MINIKEKWVTEGKINSENYKSLYLISLVMFGLITYLVIAILIKAFKISDINLKY